MTRKHNTFLTSFEPSRIRNVTRSLTRLEAEMKQAFLVCATLLFLCGCERSQDLPPVSVPVASGQTLIIQGFGSADAVSVGNEGFRVGWYFDFSDYDSLRINFSAQRLTSVSAVDHILIKVGPSSYFSDSLSAPQKNLSVLITPNTVTKSQFAALVFIVPDAETTLLLSQLRVIGWPTR
jgi:hypothetical protein